VPPTISTPILIRDISMVVDIAIPVWLALARGAFEVSAGKITLFYLSLERHSIGRHDIYSFFKQVLKMMVAALTARPLKIAVTVKSRQCLIFG
jgi:hypothetical protein